jgi:hypothetical protein
MGASATYIVGKLFAQCKFFTRCELKVRRAVVDVISSLTKTWRLNRSEPDFDSRYWMEEHIAFFFTNVEWLRIRETFLSMAGGRVERATVACDRAERHL